MEYIEHKNRRLTRTCSTSVASTDLEQDVAKCCQTDLWTRCLTMEVLLISEFEKSLTYWVLTRASANEIAAIQPSASH